MKTIKFRRPNNSDWEPAKNEKDLHIKLNGDMAEVVMPNKPMLVRLWRRLFPLKGIEVPADGVMREAVIGRKWWRGLLALVVLLLLPLAAAAQEKKIHQEPLWYTSLSASALDIISSAAVIDGKRIAEGNPLLRTEDGKVHWPRALAYTAFTHLMEWRTYKKSRKWGIFVMVVNTVIRGGLGGARNIVLYYKHVY